MIMNKSSCFYRLVFLFVGTKLKQEIIWWCFKHVHKIMMLNHDVDLDVETFLPKYYLISFKILSIANSKNSVLFNRKNCIN